MGTPIGKSIKDCCFSAVQPGVPGLPLFRNIHLLDKAFIYPYI
jgi:hypothetical protein